MMNERTRVEIIYKNNTYEVDVNPHDKVHQMIEDLYHSILIHETHFSIWQKVCFSLGKYVVRNRAGKACSLHDEIYDTYYRFEL